METALDYQVRQHSDQCGRSKCVCKSREATAELASLRQREKRLREMLKRLFYDNEALLACPICGNDLDIEHAPDCELAALLKEE